MNIDDKLKEVGNYFKAKLLEGDYEFIKCSDYTAEILIDKKYKFEVWIANVPKDNFQFYRGGITGEDAEDFLRFTTQKDRIKAYSKIKNFVKDYQNGKLKREKMAQFEKLKKELELT